jgi:hypothetical protein
LQNGKSLGTFCGSSKPLKAKKPGASITVYLYVGMCGSTPSVPSEGRPGHRHQVVVSNPCRTNCPVSDSFTESS